ncbi:MAG: GNAT family N-acetyltransferase [Clostridia bacterium]|nr:GNAT family N-acetyltransferase [Clostridia bacterium]
MISFREGDSRDAALISHINATSWRKAYRGIIPQHYLDRLPDEYWVPSVRAWLDSGRFSALIVLEDKKPQGACIYGRSRDESLAGWGEIVSLYLLPEARRRGLGSRLLEEAVSRLQADGYARLFVWSFEKNLPADAFYRRHGFFPSTDRESVPLGGAVIHERRYVKAGD